jgi:hypothetical protein
MRAMDMTISMGNVITVLAMLVGGSVAWGVLKQKLDDHEARLRAHTGEIASTDACLLEIKVKLAEIARDIVYIRERLGKYE